MERDQTELALYVIDLKIAKEIKENEDTNFSTFSTNIKNLKDEKQEIYKGNKEIINKILTEYLKDVKKGE